jgi:uncharacterized caspase-like protein
MRISVCLAFIGAFAAAACASAATPEATPPADHFKALTGKPARQLAASKLCLLLTANTGKTFDYLNGMRDSLAGSAMAGFDSRRMVADITRVLQSRFREIAPLGSSAELSANACPLALSLDLKITLSPGIRKEGVAEINASFADKDGARAETIAVAVSKQSWGSLGEAGLDAWAAAIADFGDKMDASAPLLALAADAQTVATAGKPGAQDASAAIELAFWDSVKSSASPADFQAYLREFPNGSFASLARSRLAALGETAPVRVNPLPAPAAGSFNFGTYHALVIGIDNYRSVTPLKNAAADARAVAKLLQKDYGFTVTLLLDATRNQMIDAFDELRRTLTDKDNLLIYYAGHGHLDAAADRGFWLPVDADANRRANWLSNSDIADMVRATRAKHVLLVADSCYAGTLTRSLAVQMTALDDFARLAQKRARTALVSGGLEPVEDAGGGAHSVFAKAFLEALQANTGVADMSQLFSTMRRQVILNARQTPQYSDIRQVGHEGGDFIFVRAR